MICCRCQHIPHCCKMRLLQLNRNVLSLGEIMQRKILEDNIFLSELVNIELLSENQHKDLLDMRLLEFLEFVFSCFEEGLQETFILVENIDLDLFGYMIQELVIEVKKEVGFISFVPKCWLVEESLKM